MSHRPFTSRARGIALAAFALALTLAAPAAFGQLFSFDTMAINVALTGSEVSPTSNTKAVGECSGYVDPGIGELGLTCTSSLSSPGSLVLTNGKPGAGTQIANLGSGRTVNVERTFSDETIAAIITGQVWVAFTTSSRPTGEIAAPLIPRPTGGESVMLFPLRKDSLVNSTSSAVGNCALRISENETQIDVLCTHNVSNPSDFRVIIDGGVVQTVNDVASPFEASLPSILTQYDRFLTGKYGVVLTSAARPNGELGMVLDKCIESPTTLCVNGRRFRVTVDFTAPGSAVAEARTAPQRSSDAGLFWFFDPSNWEVVVKVLNACALNQKYWVFLSANTDVAFTATVYDTLTGRTQSYSNPQGRLAVPVADTNSVFSCS